MRTVYLDHNATAPIRPSVRQAVIAAMEVCGNPSSVHGGGRTARAIIETARAAVAKLVQAKPGSVTFTSGGTEANALAIASARRAGFARCIVSAGEHPAVSAAANAGGAVEVWPLTADGVADPDWLDQALALPGKALVCLMAANNETGVIQPIREAGERVRAAGGWMHVDAVQAAGRMPLDLSGCHADTMALSAHKIGGPTGVGALIAGTRAEITASQIGGGQEQGRRAGTENIAGIAGMGAAALDAAVEAQEAGGQSVWRDAFEARLQLAGAQVFGQRVPRLSQTSCVAMQGFEAYMQVMQMDLEGVRISAGAACSSGKMKPSAVLVAMGAASLADQAIRVSGGWNSQSDDWSTAADVWLSILARRTDSALHRREA